MPRPRIYGSEAERQAAHRKRREKKAGDLMGRLFMLERTVWEAADAGDPVANSVKAASIEGMLEALITHFESQKQAATISET